MSSELLYQLQFKIANYANFDGTNYYLLINNDSGNVFVYVCCVLFSCDYHIVGQNRNIIKMLMNVSKI